MASRDYSFFGVTPQTSASTAAKAHRRMLRKAHPDTGGSSEAFHEVQEAWGRLLALPKPFGNAPEVALVHTSLFAFGWMEVS